MRFQVQSVVLSDRLRIYYIFFQLIFTKDFEGVGDFRFILDLGNWVREVSLAFLEGGRRGEVFWFRGCVFFNIFFK